jgi:hypothetical protein
MHIMPHNVVEPSVEWLAAYFTCAFQDGRDRVDLFVLSR